METIVFGPATISFSWRLLGPDGRGWLALEIDDREMATLRRALPWQPVQINLPPGSHTIRIKARGMARVPGSAAEADQFVVNPGARLPWLTGVDEDPQALWVTTGSGQVAAEVVPHLSGIDDGKVATVKGTGAAGRTSLVRLVQGPARLAPRVNVKGGSFVARDLDSVGAIRRVNSSTGSTWNASPLVIGPGLHRVEWVHFYWAQLENEKDPYPLVPPASLTASPADVATLASLEITPLTLDSTLAGGLSWTSTGTNPFVPTLAAREPNSLNPDQLAALAIERAGPGQDARLSTVITGPAEVSLRISTTGPSGDMLRVLAGEEVKYVSYPEGDTGSPIFEVPAGPVTVEIEWIGGFGTDGFPRTAALTGVEVRQSLPVEAKDALDAPTGLTFYTTNPELWDTATADPRAGLAARTRPLPLNPLSFPELSAWVEGPAVLTYWRRADLPAGSTLGFPGVPDAFNPGPFSWQAVNVPVPEGRHRLVWYSPRAPAFFGASARYFLDGFSVQPGTGTGSVSLAEALDTPDLTWTSSGNDVTAGNFDQLAFDGVDAVSLAPLGEGSAAWVETTVTGPAVVSFHSSRSVVGIQLDGVFPQWGFLETYLPDDPLWRRTEIVVPPGEHVLRLDGTDSRYPALLDVVTVTPQPALSLAEAVDAPGLTFTSSGDRWQAFQSPLASDGDALFASGAAGTGWIETEITGPARVEFEWQAGPEYTRLSLELDGAEIAVVPTYQTWQTVAVEIPAGAAHSFRWVFASPENRRGNPAGLNQLSVTPLSGATLGDVLEAPARTWLTTGPLPAWTAQGEVSHDGEDAARVPSWEDESIERGNVLQTSVTGPTLVRFWWHKDGPGMAFFEMDGRNIAELVDEDDWQEVTATVPPGNHILRWSTFKNHYFEPRPALSVDDFRLESLPETLTLGEVLDAPALPWRTSASAPWEFAWRSLPEGGQELAAISPSPLGETTWIETDVTGPAVLSFLYLDDTFGLSQGNLVVDGTPVLSLRGAAWPNDAAPVRWPIPAGPHTIRWEWTAGPTPTGSTRLERLMVDRVEIATGRPELATLFPGGTSVNLGNGHPWTVQPAPGGGFRAESHPIAPGSQSGLNMVIPGNRELAFRTGWAGLRPNRMGGNFLNAGGMWYAIHGLSGYAGDEMNSVWHVPAGDDQLLTWSTASAQGIVDAMFLDQVSVNEPVHPLGEALGAPAKTFFSTGSGRWHGQTTRTHAEGAAVSSGGSGSLITYFTGPGTVSWWWKGEAASADASAGLIAWLPGNPVTFAVRNSSFDWERREVVLPWATTYRLEWRAYGSGYEAGQLLLDQVTFKESATDTYTAWAVGKLSGGESAAMDADPDGDGQSNLMEFAFGSDPTSQRSAYRQDIRIESGLIHVCLTLPEHDTTGLDYDVEFSPDLQHWTRLHRIPGGPSVPDDPVTCAVPSTAPAGSGFVRIRLRYASE